MSRKKKLAIQTVPEAPKVSQTALKALYKELERHWDEQAEHYGYDLERPENVTMRMQAVLGAPDLDRARAAVLRAQGTIQVMILGAWARGKIPGPLTERSLEARIKRTEALASMLDSKGQKEAADRQRERAETLRGQLQDLTLNQQA